MAAALNKRNAMPAACKTCSEITHLNAIVETVRTIYTIKSKDRRGSGTATVHA